MTLSVDVYFSFRSPYSYLVTPRLVELQEKYDLEFRVRPVLPIAVRMKDFFDRVNPLWPPYLMRDTMRLAEHLGLPFRWPRPDPVVQTRDAETGRMSTAADQPYIHRVTRLGQLAVEAGQGVPFVREVSALIFAGTEGWNVGDHLARAAERAGCDLASLEPRVEAESERIDAAIASNQDALEAAGHWGVPTMVFENEAFFGQDRLDLLVWRLGQHGLRERG
jgi:2-hydroxychromene-2-carboxylate isomerase